MNDDVKQTEDTSANCPESRPWYREPVNAKDIHRGCLCCSTAAELAPMEMVNGLDRDINGARGILLRALTRQLEPEIITTSGVSDVAV